MKCTWKGEFPNSKEGEHHYHADICCKCGWNNKDKHKLDKKDLLKLREMVW